MQKSLQIKSTMKRIKQKNVIFTGLFFLHSNNTNHTSFHYKKFNPSLFHITKFEIYRKDVSFHYKTINPKGSELTNVKFKVSVDLDWSSVGETRNDSMWFTGLGSLAGLNIWAGLNGLGKKVLRQVFDALKIECVK